MSLYITSVVYCKTFLHFMSSLINNCKKTNSESLSTPNSGVLNVEFALKLRIYRSLKSEICLLFPKDVFVNTAYSAQLPFIAGHSL